MQIRQAMILAAGRGKRMSPLTDTTPKPLLTIRQKPLIVYHIEKLAKIGITKIVINHAWLGDQIVAALGDGTNFGVKIDYSPEIKGGLETAGGIIQALDILDDTPFLVINADVWCDINFVNIALPQNSLAHLVLVNNPTHHKNGDFGFMRFISNEDGFLSFKAEQKFTYSGVGIFTPELFKNYPKGRLSLRSVFKNAMPQNKITGELYDGIWSDIGTPDRLIALQKNLFDL